MSVSINQFKDENDKSITGNQYFYAYKLKIQDECYYIFNVNIMTRCCGTLMLHSFYNPIYISPLIRKIISENREKILEAVISLARQYNASNITYFDIEENDYGNKGKINIIFGETFKKVHSYKNDNSGNTVGIYTYNL